MVNVEYNICDAMTRGDIGIQTSAGDSVVVALNLLFKDRSISRISLFAPAPVTGWDCSFHRKASGIVLSICFDAYSGQRLTRLSSNHNLVLEK